MYNGQLFNKKGMKLCILHKNGWNWKSSHRVIYDKFRRTNVAHFYSGVESRPKNNGDINNNDSNYYNNTI